MPAADPGGALVVSLTSASHSLPGKALLVEDVVGKPKYREANDEEKEDTNEFIAL
jgi:hypothetical protein